MQLLYRATWLKRVADRPVPWLLGYNGGNAPATLLSAEPGRPRASGFEGNAFRHATSVAVAKTYKLLANKVDADVLGGFSELAKQLQLKARLTHAPVQFKGIQTRLLFDYYMQLPPLVLRVSSRHRVPRTRKDTYQSEVWTHRVMGAASVRSSSVGQLAVGSQESTTCIYAAVLHMIRGPFELFTSAPTDLSNVGLVGTELNSKASFNHIHVIYGS